MATAPTVQSLEDIMGELSPGYDSQRGVITKQQEATGARYNAQITGLDAAKVKGFNDINTQATGRGMTFSGIPLNEQAEYLSYKYLPGVQAAQAQQNADILTLEGQKAALDTDIRNRAFSSRENQVGAQNQWNLQQAAQEAAAEAARIERDFRASEAEKDRAHQAAQAAADRAFQASQAAANRAASAAAAAAAQPQGISGSQLSGWAANYVKGKQGSDKKISPSAYYAGFSDFYTQTGLGAEDYAAVMSKYVNTSHLQDYRLE